MKDVFICIHGTTNVPFLVYANHIAVIKETAKDFKVGIATTHGVKVAQARNELIKAVRDSKADYIFFLDTDHIIQDNTVKLLEQSLRKGFSMVSGLINRRRGDMTTIGFLHDTEQDQWQKLLLPCDDKVYPVDTCAFGCTLIKLKDLLELDEPWFRDTCELSDKGKLINRRSDINICKDFRAKGKKIGIDTRVKVGHVGENIIVFPQNADQLRQLKQEGKLKRPPNYSCMPEDF